MDYNDRKPYALILLQIAQVFLFSLFVSQVALIVTRVTYVPYLGSASTNA